jgi:hypothetical protein
LLSSACNKMSETKETSPQPKLFVDTSEPAHVVRSGIATACVLLILCMGLTVAFFVWSESPDVVTSDYSLRRPRALLSYHEQLSAPDTVSPGFLGTNVNEQRRCEALARLVELSPSAWRCKSSRNTPDSIADFLVNTIEFIVVTSSSRHDTQLTAVLETWGSGTGIKTVVSDAGHAIQPVVLLPPPVQPSTPARMIDALNEMCSRMHPDAEWFVLANDDTYVFVEHVAQFLGSFSSARPTVLGRGMLSKDGSTYLSFAASVVMSKAAMTVWCDQTVYQRRAIVEIPATDEQTFTTWFERLGIHVTDIDSFYPGSPNSQYTKYEPVPDNLSSPLQSQRARLPLSYGQVTPDTMGRIHRDWALVRDTIRH